MSFFLPPWPEDLAQRRLIALTMSPEVNRNVRPSIFSCFLAVLLVIKLLVDYLFRTPVFFFCLFFWFLLIDSTAL